MAAEGEEMNKMAHKRGPQKMTHNGRDSAVPMLAGLRACGSKLVNTYPPPPLIALM